MFAIGMQPRWPDARLVRPSTTTAPAHAVTKEHAGGAVVEVEDAGEGLGAHHQRAAGGPRADHRVCHGQGIDETRTHRLDVERRQPLAPMACWKQAVDGKNHVRRGRRDDDQVDVLGRAASRLQGLRRLPRPSGWKSRLTCEMPGMNARAPRRSIRGGFRPRAAISGPGRDS